MHAANIENIRFIKDNNPSFLLLKDIKKCSLKPYWSYWSIEENCLLVSYASKVSNSKFLNEMFETAQSFLFLSLGDSSIQETEPTVPTTVRTKGQIVFLSFELMVITSIKNE